MRKVKRINVIDVEATCWENQKDKSDSEIIEIGITPIVAIKDGRYDRVEIQDSVSIIVLPNKSKISEFCTNLTSLTPEFVQTSGINFWSALDQIDREFDPKNSIFASWGDYDRKMFEQECKQCLTKYPFSNLHLNVKALFAAKYGARVGVETAANMLGFTFEGTPHRGIDDSRMIARILRIIL